jgi:hypothetical protein
MASNRSLLHRRSRRPPDASPDVAAAAREAVIGFLHDSSMGSPALQAAQPPGTMVAPIPKTGVSTVAVKAAADRRGSRERRLGRAPGENPGQHDVGSI